MARQHSPYTAWLIPIREEINRFVDEHPGLKFKRDLGDALGINYKVFATISTAEAVSTDVEAYAKLFRVGIVSADPTGIPPRRIMSRGIENEQPRSWTPEQYNRWLAKQSPLSPMFTDRGPMRAPQEPATVPPPSQSAAQVSKPAFGQDPIGMPTQPVTPVGPAMAMLQALDGLLGASIGAAVAPHIAAAVSSELASIISPEKIGAAIAAQIQTALNGTQAELRRLSEVVEHLQQTQAAQVPLSSVVPEKASLDEVLQAVLPRLREIGTSDSKQTLSSYYGPLYELLSLLRKVVPSRKEQINTTDITELAMTLSLLLLEYRDGTSQERDNLIAKHGVALGDLNDLVQVLTLDHTERERALTFQKERSS